jgi:signal transduction histidine kinase
MKKSLAFALIAQAISIAVIFLIALQFFQQLKLFNDYSKQVEHTYMVINQLEQTDIYLKDAETSSRGFMITKDSLFLQPLNVAKREVFNSMDSLRKLIVDNPDQKALYKPLEKIVYEKLLMQLENARNVDRISRDSLFKRMSHGRRLMEDFMDVISDMKTNELVLLNGRKIRKDASEAKLPEQVRIVFLIAGLSTLIFGFWIFIELRKRFRYQDKLQQKVLELRQNNEELEQVAFAASHDLQEPLRKIRIFSDRLMSKLKTANASEDTLTIAQRMNNSAGRMQELLNDLIAFNALVQQSNGKNGNQVLLKLQIEKAWERIQQKDEKAVLVSDDNMPAVWAGEEQVLRLFSEIFDNSYDFQLPGRTLLVRIVYKREKGISIEGLPGELKNMEYHHIAVSDNGSGFDEMYKDKIFKLFQRLHNYDTETESRRKGMGLAMCRRIMLNLNGWIDAQSTSGEGTTIHLYFPA